MSFGDNTPLTSSDDDDDNDVVQGQTMGGFTETNLDAQPTQNGGNNLGGTPISDSDDNDNDIDMNNDGNTEKYWIRVHYEGTLETFEITPYETLHDLRNKINEREDMGMSDCHYFLLQRDALYDDDQFDEEDEDELLQSGRLLQREDEKAMDYNKQTLSIYWKSFELTIVDGMDLSLNIRVSQDWTIKKLKDEVERNHSVRLQCLSHSGMELIDDQQLQYHDITKSGYTLISRISINIEDVTCDISTDLLICDFWDFEKVLTTYLDAERREPHKYASFYYLGQKIPLTEQVYSNRLTNRSKLEYKVEAYPINIYDSESALIQSQGGGVNNNDLNAFTLDVYDQWTLNDVKKAYSKATKKPFMEKEKFLSQERELEENVPLWKLRIRDNEKLIIEREQQEVVVGYICCECGAKVNLRRYDSVQCRSCFHGAVYKQRTARVCQYSCR